MGWGASLPAMRGRGGTSKRSAQACGMKARRAEMVAEGSQLGSRQPNPDRGTPKQPSPIIIKLSSDHLSLILRRACEIYET
jgi:hypothetical protein